MALHYFHEKIVEFPYYCLVIAIAGFFLHYTELSDLLYPISLALAVYFFAFCIPVLNLSRIGDLSYGVYIVHFPILQTLISFGIFDNSDGKGCYWHPFWFYQELF